MQHSRQLASLLWDSSCPPSPPLPLSQFAMARTTQPPCRWEMPFDQLSFVMMPFYPTRPLWHAFFHSSSPFPLVLFPLKPGMFCPKPEGSWQGFHPPAGLSPLATHLFPQKSSVEVWGGDPPCAPWRNPVGDCEAQPHPRLHWPTLRTPGTRFRTGRAGTYGFLKREDCASWGPGPPALTGPRTHPSRPVTQHSDQRKACGEEGVLLPSEETLGGPGICPSF